ncbi:MAG TPA: terminase small subunit [Nitrospira sp.]|nr:terminase small subunit [Nitrospira sp.]
MSESTAQQSFWAADAMAPQLTASERVLRDKFIVEYLKDYDAFGASLRAGFMSTMAIEYAKRFLEEPYVQSEIARLERAAAEDPKAEEEQRKRFILASLTREANYRGPGSSHAARVAALAKLGNFLDMDGVQKTKNEHLHRGGVMAVPGIASLEDWEKAAKDSQTQLVKDTQT